MSFPTPSHPHSNYTLESILEVSRETNNVSVCTETTTLLDTSRMSHQGNNNAEPKQSSHNDNNGHHHHSINYDNDHNSSSLLLVESLAPFVSDNTTSPTSAVDPNGNLASLLGTEPNTMATTTTTTPEEQEDLLLVVPFITTVSRDAKHDDASFVDVELTTTAEDETILPHHRRVDGRNVPEENNYHHEQQQQQKTKKNHKSPPASPTATAPLSPASTKMGDMEENVPDDDPLPRRCNRRTWWGLALLWVVLAAIVLLLLLGKQGDEEDPTTPSLGVESNNASPPTTGFPSTPTVVVPPSSPSTPVAGRTPPGVPTPRSLTPTWSPTTATPPTGWPSRVPTLASTPEDDLGMWWVNLLQDLTPVDVLQDTRTIQGQALEWLWQTSTAAATENEETMTTTLRQRYVLSVLDRATHPEGGAATITQPGDHCTWQGITCANGTHWVEGIHWANAGLTGTLVEEIKGLTALVTLDLAENALQGPLPDGLFECRNLQYLYLYQNQLTGELSERFANLPNLIRLYLGDNQFSGRLPQAFGSPFPLSGRDLRPLRFLSVHNNNLVGPIPEFWNLRFLYYLDLSRNSLTGSIPNDWFSPPSDFVRLRLLFLDHNQLSGQVNANMTSNIGNGRLELLHLQNNQFTGVMPGGFDRFFFISSLEIQHNNFEALDPTVCDTLVFGTSRGEVTNFHADCNICTCNYFCEPSECYN